LEQNVRDEGQAEAIDAAATSAEQIAKRQEVERSSPHQGEKVDLAPYRGEYEKKVDEYVLDWLPGAKLGQQLMEMMTGERISGTPVDRRELGKELAWALLREAAFHLLLEGAGEALEGALAEDAAEVTVVRMSEAEYLEALSRTFPEHQWDEVYRFVDDVGKRAADVAVRDPEFVAAYKAGNDFKAGRLFHDAANDLMKGLGPRIITPPTAPPGWTVQTEKRILDEGPSGRADVLLGQDKARMDFDWKTTGKSALSERSVKQLDRHAAEIAGQGWRPERVESRSWHDYMPDWLRVLREQEKSKQNGEW
jgi:hypothetical protein